MSAVLFNINIYCIYIRDIISEYFHKCSESVDNTWLVI